MGVGGFGVFLALLLSGGCAARFSGPAARVRKISMEGNGGIFHGRSDKALVAAMAHPKPRGVGPFRKKVDLDEEALEEDRRRVENWYANRGFFEAKLVRWQIEEKREARKAKPPVVVVRGVVDENERSMVRTFRWEGLEGLSPPIVRTIQNQVPLREGKPFDVAAYDETLALTTTTLKNQSFAYAVTKGRIEVTPSEHAVDVLVTVDMGPSSRFGDIEIVGGHNVPPRMVRDKVLAVEGEPYRLRDLEGTQRRLYGMNVFSRVEVAPRLEERSPDVPVEIHLKPRDPREIRIGGGSQISSGRQEALASLRFEHNNLFEQVMAFDLKAEGGYAFVGADLADGLPTTGVRGGPVADVTAAFTLPYVPGRGWQAEIEAQFEENIEEAYRYLSPSVRPSLTGTLSPHWTLSLGYELRYQQYLDLQIDPADLEELMVAPDLVREHYINTQFMETILWDTRNDVIRPTSGGHRSLTLIQAGHFLGGDFDYFGTQVDVRTYQSVRKLFPRAPALFVIAGRVGGGWLEPYGPAERAYVPYGERLELGGSSSVRGWIADHLGPYVCSSDAEVVCTSDPDTAQPEADTVPVGGLVSAFGSLEVRKYWDPWGIVAFVDVGMVWENANQIGDLPVAPAVGPGFRYKTPVGAVRFDLAVRTDDLEMFQNEPRLWFHLGLGEAF
jgi:translocation and assembly module TamA